MAKKIAKNFEDAMMQLEENVKVLEGGDITLEESIKAYKKGMDLAAYCAEVLKKAEQEIFVYEEGQYKKVEMGEEV